MIKRTLYFGNPSYLSLRNAQLVIVFGQSRVKKLYLICQRYKFESESQQIIYSNEKIQRCI